MYLMLCFFPVTLTTPSLPRPTTSANISNTLPTSPHHHILYRYIHSLQTQFPPLPTPLSSHRKLIHPPSRACGTITIASSYPILYRQILPLSLFFLQTQSPYWTPHPPAENAHKPPWFDTLLKPHSTFNPHPQGTVSLPTSTTYNPAATRQYHFYKRFRYPYRTSDVRSISAYGSVFELERQALPAAVFLSHYGMKCR